MSEKPLRRLLNGIEWRAPKERAKEETPASERTRHAERRRAAPTTVERPAKRPAITPKSDADSWAVPESVKDRFTQDGRRYYFADGAPAFRDHGRRLTTPSENTEVVASLIDIAKARGWDSIRVRGTERFRQEAWKQGKLAGLNVRGYRPSAGERAAMIRGLARVHDDARSPQQTAAPEPTSTPSPADDRRREAPRGIKPRPEARITGKLLDHGREHYKFDPKADMSYFVRLETANGKRVVWGTGFERAFNESLSQPKIGDRVVVQHRGTDAVKVKRRELDETGKVIQEKSLDTHRNSWRIERSDFLESRAQAAQVLRDSSFTPKQIKAKHPELAGTLLQLRAAELASKRFHDPQDREIFVAKLRNALADGVARGEPLARVQLRDRRERRPPEKSVAREH